MTAQNTTTDLREPSDPGAVSGSEVRRAALTAMATSAIEWYDFFIYGTAAALVFGTKFFPSVSPVAGVLAAFATFAIGFAARPLGGIVCGHYGDKFGRKPVLVATLVLMGVATMLIGLLPTFSTIGVAAPIMLALLRFAQGLAVGGQWGGAMLVATEYAPPGRRGLYGSFVQLGVPVGLILGNLTFLLMTSAVGKDDFEAWGWRVPFVFSVVMIALAMFVHKRLEETPAYQRAEERLSDGERTRRRSPVLEVLRSQPKQILFAAGSFLVVNASFYLLVTGMLDYGSRHLGMSKGTVLTAVLLGNSAQLVALPLFAWLSDHVGRRRVYAAGVVALGIWAFPMFRLVDTERVPLVVLAMVGGGICLSAAYGPQAALFAEMFSAEVRFSGASLGYQIAAVLGGGLAPFLMVLLLESTHTSMSISLYMAVMAAVALLSLWRIRPVRDPAERPPLATR
ncbi:MHS family MFS transporter [Streptomyces sp. NA02950]|uniref:MFS transporter n=1 Tax=Streptomyces sp. NA02950 TaxID=2742137 RepID=UPI001590C37D|nr:MFS transporter [Streptomyces sp. NA02950]QKV96238.1 MHS family MFS transporter [Streptomyces sp. NA02950]